MVWIAQMLLTTHLVRVIGVDGQSVDMRKHIGLAGDGVVDEVVLFLVWQNDMHPLR